MSTAPNLKERVASSIVPDVNIENLIRPVIFVADANDLFASGPFLSETISIRFDTAGMPVNTAQHMLICRNEDEAELNSYTIETINDSGNFQMRLVNNGNVYNGDAPSFRS